MLAIKPNKITIYKYTTCFIVKKGQMRFKVKIESFNYKLIKLPFYGICNAFNYGLS